VTDRAPDPDSQRYATYWEPVLAGAGRHMLARIDVAPATYLDVGAGTGALALATADRWPEARILALDASAGMLSVARARVSEERTADTRRFEWLAADAAAIPLADASVDVVTTAFMLQLVDDRLAVLHEILRVLRPGGTLGLVTWLADDLELPADDAFAAVLAELGLDGVDANFRSDGTTDYRSTDEASAELLAAGFTEIDVRIDELRYAWTREDYLVFKEHFDESEVFEALEPSARARLRQALLERWAALPDSAFELRAPLVSVIARRPWA
jgi:ubiquinone/menaquinone biosynthesis C-methylase UbiE